MLVVLLIEAAGTADEADVLGVAERTELESTSEANRVEASRRINTGDTLPLGNAEATFDGAAGVILL
jgi:hypothetical protein